MSASEPDPPFEPGEAGHAPERRPAGGPGGSAPPRRRRRRSPRSREAELALRQWADERREQRAAAPARPLRPIAWQVPAVVMLALVNVLIWRSPGAALRSAHGRGDAATLGPEQGKVALLLVAQQVEAFRAHAGRLPVSPTELNALLPGVDYRPQSPGLYELSVLAGHRTMVYRSSVPLAVFARQLQVERAFVRGTPE